MKAPEKWPNPPLRLPVEKIVIFDREYRVITIEEADESEEAKRDLIGGAQYAKGQIYLDQTLDHIALMRTFWHECIHVAQHELRGEFNENEASQMALLFDSILRNNPELVKQYVRSES